MGLIFHEFNLYYWTEKHFFISTEIHAISSQTIKLMNFQSVAQHFCYRTTQSLDVCRKFLYTFNRSFLLVAVGPTFCVTAGVFSTTRLL